jgi:hypothetical protein
MRRKESLNISHFQLMKEWRSSSSHLLIQYHEDVRPQKTKRIQDAFTLMTEPFKEERASQATERWNSYCWLLKKVQNAVGPQLMVLCVIDLSQSAIDDMMNCIQLKFLEAIKKWKEVLKSVILQKLADEYSVLGSSNFSLHWHTRSNLQQQRRIYRLMLHTTVRS